MTVTEIYKQRLSELMTYEVRRQRLEGVSERTFAPSQLGVSHGSTQRWRMGDIKDGLRGDVLQAIADYLARSPGSKYHHLKTPESLRAWLADEVETETPASIYDQLRGRIAELEAQMLRLQCGAFMPESVISYLIMDALKVAQCNRNAFADQAGIAVTRLNQIVDDGIAPTDEEYGAIASTLNHLRNSNFQPANLKAFFENQHLPNPNDSSNNSTSTNSHSSQLEPNDYC